MSDKEDDKSKIESQPSTGPIQDRGATAEDEDEEEEKAESKDTAGFSKVENKANNLNVNAKSQVYTATKDTLFSKKTSVSETQALSPKWVFGINPDFPVFTLQDKDQLVLLYTSGFGIIYNHTLNVQHILQGHSTNISCMCVSEDRRWIATADCGSESMVIIWDAYSGIPVQTLFNCHPAGGVIAVAFSSDTKHLVTLGREKTQCVCVWDWIPNSQKPVCFTNIHPEHGFQTYVACRPTDCIQLLTGSESHVLFYSIVERNLQYLALDLKRFMKAENCAAGSAVLLPDPPRTTHRSNASAPWSLFHLRMPQILTVIGRDIVVWEVSDDLVKNQIVSDKTIVPLCLQDNPITALTMADGLIITGDTKGDIYFYDETLSLLLLYNKLNLDPIASISFTKECKKEHKQDCILEDEPVVKGNLIICTVNSTVLQLNTQSHSIQTLVHQEQELHHAVACHPSEPFVALGSQQGILKVWDYNKKTVTGRRLFETEGSIQCVSFDLNGIYLAVGFSTGSVQILNANAIQSDSPESLGCTKDSIHIIVFSSDSEYLATADAGKAVTVFHLQKKEGSQRQWICLDRYHSHSKPITDLLFGLHLDSTYPRLLSLGMDRQLVEYDLEKSTVGQLVIKSSDRIEQSAVPLCMAWFPPLTTEQFLLIASDQYKMKLLNSITKMCRKTVQGPTFGSPIKQMMILPKHKESKIKSYHLAFITEDRLGLQILPPDGNPYKSTALICHATGVSSLSSSYDGKFVFTTGVSDYSSIMWEINLNVLEAAAALGGNDMIPFYSQLDGGQEGKFYRDMEDFFYYCQIRHYGSSLMRKQPKPTEIPLSEVPSLMRAVGYFPTEQEIEDMQNEIKFSRFAETGKYVTDIDLQEFIKLYVNHRPAFGAPSNELVQAFHVLAKSNSTGQPVLQRQELLELLQARGEQMTMNEVEECFTTLLGLKKEEICEEHLLERELPEEISMEIFTDHILGFPQSNRNEGSRSPPPQ
ncbi:cilia- and flagella-associated protein 251 [Oryzias latipes]|uniref:Cilia- and flagella-associated protein 251 n=1 Tax=Oryzias latipes TaxID=8090 RepID=H2LN24_ORYLA|nr:cilia- and flagella-associated protein 251 [Oryzias latipes]XP_020561548.1 cilia- and flagella-associated protein 251 [Oryzias latipes]XP_023814183.1 cilia- and flagella-associated protein 251 [Oryzias latipes]